MLWPIWPIHSSGKQNVPHLRLTWAICAKYEVKNHNERKFPQQIILYSSFVSLCDLVDQFTGPEAKCAYLRLTWAICSKYEVKKQNERKFPQ